MTGPALTAALAAAAAAGLLATTSAHPARDRGPAVGAPGGRRRSGPTAAAGVLVVVVVPALLSGLVPARRLVLVALLLGALLVGARLVAGRRRRRQAAATRQRVLEACEEVRAELVAGRTPGEALARAAREWPPLGPVAEADRLGADVPAALRALARLPGADDLAAVAGAWHVAHRTGAGLAEALGRVARDLAAQRSLRRVVEGELASARATARLVATLPLLALLMGAGAGGEPWAFLLDTGAGLACLGAGLALGAVGLGWIEAIAAGVERGRG